MRSPSMPDRLAAPRLRTVATAMSLSVALLLGACATDDGATVREIGTEDGSSSSSSGSASGSGSASAPASGSGSASGTAGDGTAPEVEQVDADGGYTYASDVNAHRLVVRDVCVINELRSADPIDYDAIREIYTDGVHSVNSDGSVRSLGGFATAEDRNNAVAATFDAATPLDDFVTAAIDGDGIFADAGDGARAQGIAKGAQNQIMVAWTVHELNAAIDKAEAGELDADEGAPHNWDEAWAFYHGAEPGCAPYATADSRADNFGTATDDGTAQANVAILEAMEAGRDALLAGDVDAAVAARDEILRNLIVTYTQASVRYATVAAQDVAEGDLEAAAAHQAEGLAFFRVLRPLLADAGVDLSTLDLTAIDAIYDLSAEPGTGDGDVVREALAPALAELGIDDAEIGTLS